MRRALRSSGFSAALWLAVLASPALADDPIVVIASPAHAARQIEASELALIYQRKRQRWPDGSRIQPINLAADHPLRRAISRALFGVDPEAMERYWNEQYFSGVRPPFIVGSTEAMLRFVADTPGAIGYVADCRPGAEVVVIGYFDASGHWHHGRPANC